MSGNTIKVTGLKEFTRGLRRMDSDLPKGVRLALNEASNLLIDATRPKIPRRTGKAAASLRAQSTRSEARVAVGGPKAPYYPWLDFGGATGRKKATKRPFYKEGRYIFPTLAEKREDIQKVMQEALADLAKSAGMGVD